MVLYCCVVLYWVLGAAHVKISGKEGDRDCYSTVQERSIESFCWLDARNLYSVGSFAALQACSGAGLG